MDNRAAQLRALVSQRSIAVPGVPNALAAKLAERHGYQAVYVSGAAVSAGVLAMPDVGLMTLTELVQQTNYVVRATSLPVIVDADTGFGAAIHVQRTVRDLEVAGAAAIQIEDQVFPKKCGHLSGKQLISVEEMCAKLRAACQGRQCSQTILIARTDARGTDGLQEAVQRALRYLDAGADWIFPEGLESVEEFASFAHQVRAPLVANMTEFGRSPLVRLDELAALGYAAILYPVTLLRLAMKVMDRALQVLAIEQTQQALLPDMMTRAELYELLDYRDYEERDRQYFGGEIR
jgi:methylisocitrate lyase